MRKVLAAWIGEGFALLARRVEPKGVICRNLSTGQTVGEAAPAIHVHDCQALGLTVNAGDRIQISARGVVE